MLERIAYIACLLLSFACLFGMTFLWRYSKRSLRRNFLILVLGLWFTAYSTHFLRYVNLIEGYEPVTGYFSFHLLLSGMLGYMSLIYYCLISITTKKFPVFKFLRYSIPFASLVVIYCIVCVVMGVDINAYYQTFEEFKAVAFTLPMILRYLIVLCFMVYVAILLFSIWSLVPICNRFIMANHSDSDYNLLWIKNFVRLMSCVSVVYFIWVIYASAATIALYCFVAIPAFVVLVDNSVYHKTFKPIDGLNIKRRGVRLEITSNDVISCLDLTPDANCLPGAECEDCALPSEVFQGVVSKTMNFTFEEFERWMSKDRPYENPDFSFSDVQTRFPQLNFIALGKILAARDYTFQSYVRRCRILRAIELITDDSTSSMLYKEVYNQVGFKHYSSFSRAFVAVPGVSPSKLFG